jgi:hypothetical protein
MVQPGAGSGGASATSPRYECGSPDGGSPFLEARILAPFLLTALIWGSTWIAIEFQLGDVRRVGP